LKDNENDSKNIQKSIKILFFDDGAFDWTLACFHFFFLLRSPPDPFLFATVVNAIMELTM
jgi:hypothetical protein